jgi:hypothetical protein
LRDIVTIVTIASYRLPRQCSTKSSLEHASLNEPLRLADLAKCVVGDILSINSNGFNSIMSAEVSLSFPGYRSSKIPSGRIPFPHPQLNIESTLARLSGRVAVGTSITPKASCLAYMPTKFSASSLSKNSKIAAFFSIGGIVFMPAVPANFASRTRSLER